jgi:hypothetical protein
MLGKVKNIHTGEIRVVEKVEQVSTVDGPITVYVFDNGTRHDEESFSHWVSFKQ